MANPAVSEINTPTILDDTAPHAFVGRTRSMGDALAGLALAIEGMGTEPTDSYAPSLKLQSLDRELARHIIARPRTLRGDICALLNPMVRDGVIRGFHTNLSGGPSPDHLIVTVKATHQDESADAIRIVTQALVPLGQLIIVRVDEPDLSEVQTPGGGT